MEVSPIIWILHFKGLLVVIVHFQNSIRVGEQNNIITFQPIKTSKTSYVATPEEYQAQRYEAASTLYGPNTLTIYIQQYQKLLGSAIKNQRLNSGPQPPIQDDKQLSLSTFVFYDAHPLTANFGYVKVQPQNYYKAGSKVYAKFISGNPRNNLMHEKSYFTVEKMLANGIWKIIATDANWETRWAKYNKLIFYLQIYENLNFSVSNGKELQLFLV